MTPAPIATRGIQVSPKKRSSNGASDEKPVGQVVYWPVPVGTPPSGVVIVSVANWLTPVVALRQRN